LTFLTEISLKKASVTLLIAIALVAGGVYAALNINQELMPDINLPLITVITVQPGAAPQDIAADVTAPVEGAIASTPRLKELSSVSAENMSVVIAQFDFSADMEAAEQEVSRALNAVTLSADAGSPRVTRLNINQMLPVVQFSLSSKTGAGTAELERIARTALVPRIQSIDGVQSVDVIGGVGKQIDIVLDMARITELKLSTVQIAGVLQANNVSIPSGAIGTDEGFLPLRTVSQLTSLEDVQNLVVGFDTTGEGLPAPVKLEDVAAVGVTESPASGLSRTNGKPSVSVVVTKTQDGNTVKVANTALEQVAEVQKIYGDAVTFTTVMDSSTMVEDSIAGLTREGAIGAAAAVIAIWLFLLSFRSAIATAVSIPLSIVVAVLVLFMQGFTLNILTLGGLAMAIGRVVDDSIVVLENIFRHVQESDDLNAAIISGTREVSVAIFGSTMTTIAVFLPLGFAGGMVGVLFRPFALTVTIALLASLVVALTVVPILARFLVGRRQLGRWVARDRQQTTLQRAYTPVLRWALAHRALTLLIAAILFVGSLGLTQVIPTTFMSHGGEKEFYASISLPPESGTPDMAIEKAIEAETIIAGLPGVDVYSTSINLGTGAQQDIMSLGRMLQGQGALGASVTVRLYPDADLPAVTAMARQRLAAMDGALTSVSGGSAEDMYSALEVSVTGDDPDAVKAAAIDILAAVRDTTGVTDVSSAAVVSRSEVAVEVNPKLALGAGLTGAQVAMLIRQLTTGQTVTTVHIDGEPLDVVMRADPAAVGTVEALSALTVGSFGETSIPLSAIAGINYRQAPAQITRLNQKPSATVSGTITAENTGEANREIVNRVDSVSLPPGVEVTYGGVQQQFMESFNTLYVGIAAGVVIVYIVMVLVMGSLISPFVIMFTLPLASIGALALLAITGRALSMSSLFGVLMLVGIVVTNGIVLIDFVNQLRGRGMSVRDALMEGGRLRLRPVLMTAVTTMLAMLPIALGFTEGAVMASDLATVVIGGLFSSTLLTLVVVPVVYSLLEGLRTRVTRAPTPTPEPQPAPTAGA